MANSPQNSNPFSKVKTPDVFTFGQTDLSVLDKKPKRLMKWAQPIGNFDDFGAEMDDFGDEFTDRALINSIGRPLGRRKKLVHVPPSYNVVDPSGQQHLPGMHDTNGMWEIIAGESPLSFDDKEQSTTLLRNKSTGQLMLYQYAEGDKPILFEITPEWAVEIFPQLQKHMEDENIPPRLTDIRVRPAGLIDLNNIRSAEETRKLVKISQNYYNDDMGPGDDDRDYDEDMDYDPDYDDEESLQFANPGSALRAERPDNPRIYPCPTCKYPNKLTPEDVALGYQCDSCADAAEKRIDIQEYKPEEAEGISNGHEPDFPDNEEWPF